MLRILYIPPFSRELKRLVKKYPSLKKEFPQFLKSMEEDPTQGQMLGNNCYKIRLAIASKGKGKSGGARIITCVQIVDNAVYLLSIFDKSEKENISDNDLLALLQFIP